jgi:hypothetical protein
MGSFIIARYKGAHGDVGVDSIWGCVTVLGIRGSVAGIATEPPRRLASSFIGQATKFRANKPIVFSAENFVTGEEL